MRIGLLLPAATAVALLTTGGVSADPLRRTTEGPISAHPDGSLTTNLACAGVLFAVFEHYGHGASDLAGGNSRDATEKVMFAFRKQAIRAFFEENGMGWNDGTVSDVSSGVVINGVFETVEVYSYPYQFRLAPKAATEPAEIIAAIQADVTHCIQLHEDLK